jgi:trehalose synthase
MQGWVAEMRQPPKFVHIAPLPLERFEPLLGPEVFARMEAIAVDARREFEGVAIWHVNSTARGGGVAEILQSLLPYARGAGVDTRWVVMRNDDPFFRVTKRLHNRLHEDPGDGGDLGDAERRSYEGPLAANAGQLSQLIQPGDVLYLHDPQTAGLVPAMKEIGARVIWRCHIGVDEPGPLAHSAWDFLRPYVEDADAFVFSRRQYVWEGLEIERVWLMPPAIDPFAPKNQALEPATIEAILGVIGLGRGAHDGAPFTRADGSPARVERQGVLLQEEPLPPHADVVLQVSRWDRLKDPLGLLECFVKHVEDSDVHLVLAGPEAAAVSDDPEGEAVYGSVAESWRALDDQARRRVHLASLPMYDSEENGAMVNAIQRRATVIVQKSIAEGFGLTVAEGMWKERPFVASRVGGIQDQIVDGESGLLVDDPHDLEGFGRAITSLLHDKDGAAAMGAAARRRVMERFLAIGRLAEYVELIRSLVGQAQRSAR